MFDREVIRDFRSVLRPFLPLFIVIAVVVGIGLGLLSYVLFSSQKSAEQPHIVTTESAPIAQQTLVEQSVEQVAPQEQPAQPQQVAQPPAKKPAAKTAPAASPAPTVVVPQFSVSFFGGGCEAVIKAQPGAKVIIGAFNDSKGGESRYFMPASGTLIQRTSGIWGMTSFVQILADDGSTALYKTSTIVIESCPPAGVSEW